MDIPYLCLSRLGQSSIFCAAKGTSIHTFDLKDDGYSFVSSWTHPLAKQTENGKIVEEAAQGGEPLDEQEETDQPPSKKRKLDSDEKPNVKKEANQDDTRVAEGPANGNEKKKKPQRPELRSQRTELPFVVLLTATEDGSHVVAVTSQDKTLWVFEHDGKGTLTKSSQRVMPKRPSSISITTDGATILSADKFGDVYSLPLLPTKMEEEAAPSVPEAPATPETPMPAPAPSTYKPSASRFTVHSQRNLRALEEQERMVAKRRETPKEGPTFEHELILGHVSMLTALALATSDDGRRYIITADRDEHIRVSRGIPQAHIIENYCLGHESFLNALCVPPSRPEVLVSAGGDDEVFLWDWKAGRLLGKTNLLSHVQTVVPGTSKIGVSQLYSYDFDGRCCIVAICERVPALFIFQLTPDTTLQHVQTLNLPGNPLAALITTTRPPNSLTLIAAIDPPSVAATTTTTTTTKASPSLLLFAQDKSGDWVHSKGSTQNSNTDEGNVDISREELDKILYPVSNLRKTEFEDDAE